MAHTVTEAVSQAKSQLPPLLGSYRSCGCLRFLGEVPTPLISAPLGALFVALLLVFPTILFLSHGGMRENAEARGQSLLPAFFLSPANLDINVVRVAPFLLELPALLPEATFIGAFAICQPFREFGIHVASDLLDLDNGTLHRLLVGKGKFLHLSQEGDEVVHALVQQEKTFVNT
jgi:hypothetical protein